jgi:hypothetical protein
VSEISYAQYNEFLEKVFKATSDDKKVPCCLFASDIATGIVFGFHQVPEEPCNFMSQDAFEQIRKMIIDL